MSTTVLVTYASRAGSTAGVAESIAKGLAGRGVEINLLPVAEADDLARYQSVVVGSAIQGQSWLPEALTFVKIKEEILRKKPVAIFAVCMTLAMRGGEKYHSEISQWLAPVRSIVSPVSEGVFAGALDISKIPSFSDRLKFRFSVLSGVWTEGDYRDWDAIRVWADSLPKQLSFPTG